MRRLSSRMTFYYKRVFPVVWFGFLAFFMAAPLLTGGKAPPLNFILIPLAMMVFGYFFMKKLIFDLADEVVDAGDALIVRNADREQRIALSNVINISYSPFANPPRVTLLLRTPSVFGDQVSFCAPARFIPFSRSPAIDDLIQRVVASRRSA
jgi:hypothetical protein